MAQYDVTLRDYWRIVRKRKVIIIFASIMLGMTSFTTALLSKPKPRYRTTSKVQYEKAQTPEEAYVQAMGGSDDLETQQAVITSYPVVERVAHRLGHVDTTRDSDDDRIRAILALRPIIATGVEGLTNIISITVTHGDRFAARDIANAVAEEYRQYNYETRNALILKTRKFIRTQRDTVEARLRLAQDSLKRFQEETQVISVDAQTGAVLGQLNSAQNSLNRLQSVRASIDRLLQQYGDRDEISESILSSIPPEEGGDVFNRLNGQLQALNQERNRMLINFTEAHPLVVDLDGRKQAIMKNMLGSLRMQGDLLSRRIENQRKIVAGLEEKYRALPELGIKLGELQRVVEIQAKLLGFYEEQYQESRIAQSEEVHDVTILQRALLPTAPTNPSTPTAVAGIGAILGLILGVVFAFVAETLDTSIGTIEDVEEYLEVPVVGIIPHIDLDDMKDALIKGGVREDDTETLERRLRLAAHFEPQSTLAESYRALRTNIQFANLDKGAKVISVTSSSRQEGKSTTVANLAMTLAQSGNRVLLVDGDLRRPNISYIFGLDREPGITDVILGNYSWREVVRTVTDIMVGGLGMEDIMMTPGMDNLNIITSGAIPPNPAEITDARRMGEFIDEVRDAYDVVLFDSPPVLQATDATVLGTKMDGILLVYRIGQISRSALRRAKLQFDNVDAAVLGIVINGLRAEVSEDFRDLRYYSYYTYGSEGEEEEGSPIRRIYNRTLRRLKSLWGEFQRQTQPLLERLRPLLDRAREIFGLDRAAVPPPPGISEEESAGIHSRVLQILFWLFLLLFLAAGILWQLSGLRGPPLPAQSPPPSGVPEIAPPAEEPSKPPSDRRPGGADPQEAPPAPPDRGSGKKGSGKEPPAAGPSTTEKPTNLHPATASHRPRPAGPQPVARAAVLASESDRDPGFVVHVASHKTRTSAEREAKAFRKRGYRTRLFRIDIPGRGLFYRVLIGHFGSRREAGRAAAAMKSAGIAGYAAVMALPEGGPVYAPAPTGGRLARASAANGREARPPPARAPAHSANLLSRDVP